MGRAAAQPLETDLREAAEERYLSYALSVITSRALPDARDGLKPVQRRILYAMYQNLRLTAGARPRKSAAIVGEVLGKYHPHGDQAAYEAMVRMAQPFSLRYPLVHGEGNFGSLDGDNAAAYRYTEARLTPLAEEMLADLGAETVPLRATFDAMLEEPTVLPSAIPQLLMNGSTGIAVGMATNIPPHNLSEVVAALTAMIDEPDLDVKGLLKHVKGPDFPTGARSSTRRRSCATSTRAGRAPSGSAASTGSSRCRAASGRSSSPRSPTPSTRASWSCTSVRRYWLGSSPRCSTCATSRPPTCASSSSSRPTPRPRPRWPTSTSTPRCRRTSTST